MSARAERGDIMRQESRQQVKLNLKSLRCLKLSGCDLHSKEMTERPASLTRGKVNMCESTVQYCHDNDEYMQITYTSPLYLTSLIYLLNYCMDCGTRPCHFSNSDSPPLCLLHSYSKGSLG